MRGHSDDICFGRWAVALGTGDGVKDPSYMPLGRD